MPLSEGFIGVTPIGWEELEAKFSKGKEYMYGAALTALRRIKSILVPAIMERTPIGATGHLRNKTVAEILTLGSTENMQLEIRQSAASDSGFFYGVAVRQGTRPHFPPYRALIPWVMRKLGIATEKEAARVAYLVARKISRVGTKPNLYHVHVVEENMFGMQQIINEEMVSMLARLGP